MRAMILAAGRGERMRPLTDCTPKPLLNVGGKALIDYHIEGLQRAGFQDIVINNAWLGEHVRAHVGDGSRFGVRVTHSDERPAALETGGGIHRALPLLGAEPFLVVNGDVWTDLPFGSLRHVLGANDLAHFVMVPNPPQHQRGDFALCNGRVCEEGEPRYTFSGVGVYRPEFFEGCEPGAFKLVPLMVKAMRAHRVSGELYEGRWFDIGTPERLVRLDEQLSTVSAS
ncbi:MAG: N-acetylmuramate alpha-1-phosphate uridylyltransferase MurU [Steroidobacteraceae bacterium]